MLTIRGASRACRVALRERDLPRRLSPRERDVEHLSRPALLFACSRRCVRQRAQSGVLDSEVEVKKFYTYRALSAVAAIVALVVESGAGHKFA